jgi:hypothetical protein
LSSASLVERTVCSGDLTLRQCSIDATASNLRAKKSQARGRARFRGRKKENAIGKLAAVEGLRGKKPAVGPAYVVGRAGGFGHGGNVHGWRFTVGAVHIFSKETMIGFLRPVFRSRLRTPDHPTR